MILATYKIRLVLGVDDNSIPDWYCYRKHWWNKWRPFACRDEFNTLIEPLGSEADVTIYDEPVDGGLAIHYDAQHTYDLFVNGGIRVGIVLHRMTPLITLIEATPTKTVYVLFSNWRN